MYVDNSAASRGYPPQIYVGFFDPYVTFNMADFLYVCGNPLVYYCVLPQATTFSSLSFHAETFMLDDKVGALSEERLPASYCSSEILGLSNYTYFDGRYDSTLGGDLYNSSCDLGVNGDISTPCQFSLQLAMASSLITTQKSSRGTNTLQIFIDEGSILGGITFFAWFFSIFVVSAQNMA
jgi:hypothetical protein